MAQRSQVGAASSVPRGVQIPQERGSLDAGRHGCPTWERLVLAFCRRWVPILAPRRVNRELFKVESPTRSIRATCLGTT